MIVIRCSATEARRSSFTPKLTTRKPIHPATPETASPVAYCEVAANLCRAPNKEIPAPAETAPPTPIHYALRLRRCELKPLIVKPAARRIPSSRECQRQYFRLFLVPGFTRPHSKIRALRPNARPTALSRIFPFATNKDGLSISNRPNTPGAARCVIHAIRPPKDEPPSPVFAVLLTPNSDLRSAASPLAAKLG